MKDLPDYGMDKEFSDGSVVHTKMDGLKIETHERGFKLTFPDGAVKYHPLHTRAKEPVKFLVIAKRIAERYNEYPYRPKPLKEHQWEVGSSGASYETAISYARAKSKNYGSREFDNHSYAISVAELKPINYQEIIGELEDCKKRLEAMNAPYAIFEAVENAIDLAGAGLVEGDK